MRPKIASLTALILALAALLASPAIAAPTPPADPWASPNLLLSRDRLDEVARRRAAGDPRITAAWDQAVQEATARLNDVPQPVHGALKVPGFYQDQAGQRAVVQPLRRDASAAYTCAVAYALTGDPTFAAKAKELIFAWVDHCTHPVDGGRRTLLDIILMRTRGDTPLAIAYSFPHWIGAVDLLRGAGALDATEEARFAAWLRVFVRYHEREERSVNNHHSWQVVFLMSAGHVLRDPALFDKAVTYYRRGFRWQLLGDGAMPLELIRGEKAATYSLMNLEALLQAVHIAEMHGVTDLRGLRSLLGGDLRDAVGFVVDFVEDPARWRRYMGGAQLNGPAAPTDWGWALELPTAWWHDARYSNLTTGGPYGAGPARAYTTSFATLSFAE